jgi:hypothetical protein
LMNGDLETADGRSDLVRLALRLIVEESLEGEVVDALGRERATTWRGRESRLPQRLSDGQGDRSLANIRSIEDPVRNLSS